MSFDVPADAYDRFMGRFAAPLADAFVRWVRVPTHGRVLDVGCGPGAQLAALRRFRPTDDLVGVDPSPPFVEAARERFPGADVREAHAEDLPFSHAEFAATLAGLVVHFLTDPRAGIAEMVRVTRPGGIVGATVWDLAGGREPYAVFSRALEEVAGIPPDPLPPGAGKGELRALLADAGCTDIEETTISVKVRFPTFARWWEPYTLGVSRSGAHLARLSLRERERVRERCRELLGAGPFSRTATAWAARGTVS